MNGTRMIWEMQLQRVAVVLWLVAVCCAATAILKHVRDVAATDARTREILAVTARLQHQNESLDEDVKRIDRDIKRIERVIQEELKRKHGLELAMADVAARAKALGEQQMRFDRLREEIEDRLRNMDEHYRRKQELAGR